MPTPPAPPSRTVLIACAGAGAVGAATLPLWRVGAGWLATALAVAGAAAVARAGRSVPVGRSERAGRSEPVGDPERVGGPERVGRRQGSRRDDPDEPARRDGGGAGPEASDRIWRLGAAIAGLALIAVAAVRAAPWLVTLCLATGAALGSYAIVGVSARSAY